MSPLFLISYTALWLIVALAFVLIILLYRQLGLVYLGTSEGVNRDGLDVGSLVPEFSTPDLHGRQQTLEQFLDKPLLLVFGSPVCEPCQQLIPHLNTLAHETRDRLNHVFLTYGTVEENSAFVARYAVTVPVLVTSDGQLMEKFQVRVTPFGFIIGTDGKVKAKGLVNGRAHLERLLQESGLKDAAAPRAS